MLVQLIIKTPQGQLMFLLLNIKATSGNLMFLQLNINKTLGKSHVLQLNIIFLKQTNDLGWSPGWPGLRPECNKIQGGEKWRKVWSLRTLK